MSFFIKFLIKFRKEFSLNFVTASIFLKRSTLFVENYRSRTVISRQHESLQM